MNFWRNGVMNNRVALPNQLLYEIENLGLPPARTGLSHPSPLMAQRHRHFVRSAQSAH